VLVGMTADSIWFRPDDGRAELAVARQQLSRLELSRGMQRHGLQGAAIGLLGGAVIGATIGLATPDPGIVGTSGAVVVGVAVVGGLGLVMGAVVGVLGRSETWTRVREPGAVAPAEGQEVR
jgi:hypothetical protein